jgi:hypothetical protein
VDKVGTYRTGAAEAKDVQHDIEAAGSKAVMLPFNVTNASAF